MLFAALFAFWFGMLFLVAPWGVPMLWAVLDEWFGA